MGKELVMKRLMIEKNRVLYVVLCLGMFFLVAYIWNPPIAVDAKAMGEEEASLPGRLWREELNDLVHQAQMSQGEKYLKEKFDGRMGVTLDILQKSYGDRYVLEVDASYSVLSVESPLCILPLRGLELRNLLERMISEYKQNTKQMDIFWMECLFYGIDYSYDLSRKEGDRVIIEGFDNGKEFEWVPVYNLVLPECCLGEGIFREYSLDETIWYQKEDLKGGITWDLIADYLCLEE